MDKQLSFCDSLVTNIHLRIERERDLKRFVIVKATPWGRNKEKQEA